MKFNINKVKIVVMVPIESVDIVRDAICEIGAGVIGNYTHCSTSVKCIGTFKPNCNAKPYIGEKEKISYAFEIYDDSKKLNDYKGNIMASAPYAFYTKEAIDRLVEIWCKNVISIINDNPQNIL